MSVKTLINSIDDIIKTSAKLSPKVLETVSKEIDDLKNLKILLNKQTGTELAKTVTNTSVKLKVFDTALTSSIKTSDDASKAILTTLTKQTKNADIIAGIKLNPTKTAQFKSVISSSLKKIAKPAGMAAAGITAGITGLMFSNYMLVNGAIFSVISIENVTLSADEETEISPIDPAGYLLVVYDHKSVNKKTDIILGPSDMVEIKDTEILKDTGKINIYLPIKNDMTSSFIIKKSAVTPLTEGIYTCGIKKDESTCGNNSTITSYATFIEQIGNLDSAFKNAADSTGNIIGNISDSIGTVLNQILLGVIYIFCTILFIFITYWIIKFIVNNYSSVSTPTPTSLPVSVPTPIPTPTPTPAPAPSAFGKKTKRNSKKIIEKLL